jgi:hypothetical protein
MLTEIESQLFDGLVAVEIVELSCLGITAVTSLFKAGDVSNFLCSLSFLMGLHTHKRE